MSAEQAPAKLSGSFEPGSDGILRLKDWADLPWLTHGFTTREAGDFSAQSLDGNLPPPWKSLSLQLVRQVHSDRVWILRQGDSIREGPDRPQADSLATRRAGCLLGVRTADCLPILLLDRRTRAIAAVHAGWRGSAGRIAGHAVQAMESEFGTKPVDVEAAMGPAIRVCCYEVGPEVAEQFNASVIVPHARPHLDLEQVNRQHLLEAGVPSGHIWGAGLCTRCRTDQFYSYRREREAAGRMIAVIGLVPEAVHQH